MTDFKLTAKQEEAQSVVAAVRHVMFDGGSRSGKTFLHLRNIVLRALKAPGSRHAVLRFRFNACKQSIVLDTFPKMMRLCYPGISSRVDKTDWYWKAPNGSEVWFGGMDDKERTEKILGNEYATIYFVECSQMSYPAVELVLSRLAQKVMTKMENREPKVLPLRAFYDCNPPSKAHWTYQVFYKHISPDTKEALRKPELYGVVKMNPDDNRENLPVEYFDILDSLSASKRLRFKEGRYADATPGQLFLEDDIEKWRELDELPDMVRVIVGVDPSGADDDGDNAGNDEIGITVGGLGTDGNAYLLADLSLTDGPSTWGKVAVDAWQNFRGDRIVGEQNYGGAMVKYVIRTQNPRVPYGKVTATRGKVVRAEPFEPFYKDGRVRHAGHFPELEEELTAFSTRGYLGGGSPNRADSWVWVLTALFSGIVEEQTEAEAQAAAAESMNMNRPVSHGWMR